ncbi:hypothetical protein Tco_1423654 [Tanacetum coccineum]
MASLLAISNSIPPPYDDYDDTIDLQSLTSRSILIYDELRISDSQPVYQFDNDEAHRASKRRMECEKDHREAISHMSEEVSQGEKGETISDASTHGDSHIGSLDHSMDEITRSMAMKD